MAELKIENVLESFRLWLEGITGMGVVYAPPHRALGRVGTNKNPAVSFFIVEVQTKGIARHPTGYTDTNKTDVVVRTYLLVDMLIQVDIASSSYSTVYALEEQIKRSMQVPVSSVDSIGGILWSFIEAGGEVLPVYLEASQELSEEEPGEELRIARKSLTFKVEGATFTEDTVKSILNVDYTIGVNV